MTHAKRLAMGGVIALAITLAATGLVKWRRPEGVRLVSGVVLTADANPQRQRPVAQARVSAVLRQLPASATNRACSASGWIRRCRGTSPSR